MMKLTSSDRYISLLLRTAIGSIPVKSVKYFFDLTLEIDFSHNLSDWIKYSISFVFVLVELIIVSKQHIFSWLSKK